MSQPESVYQKSLNELLSLEFTGMKLGLDNIRELLQVLGNPQNKFKSLHIAGSNGKGSVSAILAAAMQANGYKTGLYTSPHLVNFRERIRISAEMISEEYITSFLEKIWKDVERLQATFFEVTTALAFSYFADSGVQVAIIETGLGGRLDATNVLEKPLAAVITSISLEHTAQLGDTLELIAGEKAGIMKSGVPAIVNVIDELNHVFAGRAKEVQAPITFVNDIIIPIEYRELKPPFLGIHQIQNLQTAIAALEQVDLPLKKELSIEGISQTQKLSGLHARLEEFDYTPLHEKNLKLILDAGHNPDAFKYLRQYFQQENIKPIVVAGFAKDKDISLIMNEVFQFASRYVAVEANSHRAMAANDLGKLSEEVGLDTITSNTPINGVHAALATALDGEVILLTGSHFVVGDFLKEVG